MMLLIWSVTYVLIEALNSLRIFLGSVNTRKIFSPNPITTSIKASIVAPSAAVITLNACAPFSVLLKY